MKKTPASQSDGGNSPVGFPVSICIQLAAKIGLHVEEEEFSLGSDKLSFTHMECPKIKTWLRDNGLKVIKGVYPLRSIAVNLQPSHTLARKTQLKKYEYKLFA